MPRYIVEINEVYRSIQSVEANSPEEAKELALEGAGEEIDLEYIRTPEPGEDHFRVEAEPND